MWAFLRTQSVNRDESTERSDGEILSEIFTAGTAAACPSRSRSSSPRPSWRGTPGAARPASWPRRSDVRGGQRFNDSVVNRAPGNYQSSKHRKINILIGCFYFAKVPSLVQDNYLGEMERSGSNALWKDRLDSDRFHFIKVRYVPSLIQGQRSFPI